MNDVIGKVGSLFSVEGVFTSTEETKKQQEERLIAAGGNFTADELEHLTPADVADLADYFEGIKKG